MQEAMENSGVDPFTFFCRIMFRCKAGQDELNYNSFVMFSKGFLIISLTT